MSETRTEKSTEKDIIYDPIIEEIESKKRKLTQSSSSDETKEINQNSHFSNSKSTWYQYLDTTTQKYYYYNDKTMQTQWERPDDANIIDMTQSQIPSSSSFDSSLDSYFKATFNSKTGAFSGVTAESYWSKTGIPEDRAGRQMSAFFDVNSLEANRIEAINKKKALANSNIDWKKYKAEKKSMKLYRKTQWLRED